MREYLAGVIIGTVLEWLFGILSAENFAGLLGFMFGIFCARHALKKWRGFNG